MHVVQRFIDWIGISSQLVHILCCGLPTLASIISLLSGVGLFVVLPLGLEEIHHFMHDYEVFFLVSAGAIVTLGWLLHAVSHYLDCTKDKSCCHEPCAPKKKRSALILIIATILFMVNLVIFFTAHDGSI